MSLMLTPLNARHKTLGGHMVPFAGWEMPVRYASIIEEHQSVRSRAGVFDVSHMGEITVCGRDAKGFLEKVTCNKVSDLKDGQIQYNAVLNESGGIVDDITIYRISENDYFIVSNASNYNKVFLHFKRYAEGDVVIRDESDSWHQIALQGPDSEAIMKNYFSIDLAGLNYFNFQDLKFNGRPLRISRTGYTGEDGFEIYSDVETGIQIWDRLLEKNQTYSVQPCGLASRDILRLESRYALYGHELNEEWTPVESGLSWIVKDKGFPYFSSEKLLKQKASGTEFIVVGFELTERGIPREGNEILSSEGLSMGRVLSGGFSPVLQKGIGTAVIPTFLNKEGAEIFVSIRDKKTRAVVKKGPFVRGGAGKNK